MSEIKVQWKKMGMEFTYAVWYSKKIEGPWNRHNQTLLLDTDDEAAINTYSINNLNDNTEYFIKITCNDRYDLWWYSYSDPEEVTGGFSDPTIVHQPVTGNRRDFFVEVPE
jgi:beta-xylosidase